jgi:hypothetical protein
VRTEFHGSGFAQGCRAITSWLLLGMIEATVVVLLAVSLARGEFLTPSRAARQHPAVGTTGSVAVLVSWITTCTALGYSPRSVTRSLAHR